MSSRFRIEKLSENAREKVLTLLLNSFFQDEPLAKHLQLGQPIHFAQKIFNDALNDQCSLVVYENQTKELVAIALNEIHYEHDQHQINETDEKIFFILRFLNQMHSDKNLFRLFQTDVLLHVFILNVEKKYRGCGLGSQLISATVDYAKKMNIKGIYAEATNIYSLNCFKQHGFEVYHQVNYIDYDPIRLENLNDQCQLVGRRL